MADEYALTTKLTPRKRTKESLGMIQTVPSQKTLNDSEKLEEINKITYNSIFPKSLTTPSTTNVKKTKNRTYIPPKQRQLLYTPNLLHSWLEENQNNKKKGTKGKERAASEEGPKRCENNENEDEIDKKSMFKGIPYTVWKSRIEERWDVDKKLLNDAMEWMKKLESKMKKPRKRKANSQKKQTKRKKLEDDTSKKKTNTQDTPVNAPQSDGQEMTSCSTDNNKMEEWWRNHGGAIPSAKEERLIAQNLSVSQTVLRDYILKQL